VRLDQETLAEIADLLLASDAGIGPVSPDRSSCDETRAPNVKGVR
jgi:hypothetical protein